MAKTLEDKKREILKYLEDNSKKENWFLLSKEEIYKKFVEKEFNEDDIVGIIKDLESNKRINKSDISFEIVYPKSYKKDLKTKLKHYLDVPTWIPLVISFYLIMAFLSYPKMKGYLTSIFQNDVQIALVTGLFIGLLGTAILTIILIKAYTFVEDRIPWLYDNRQVLVPMIVIALISIAIIILYALTTQQDIGLGHIIAIITVSILGGLGWAGYKKGKIPKRKKSKS